VLNKTKGFEMAQAKKTTNKKTAARKPAAVQAAVQTAPECACRPRGVCWKKVLIFVIGLVVGAAGCCLFSCRDGHKKMWMKKFAENRPEFVNGCLDLSKAQCPDMEAKAKLKDADGDGCITKEEFFGDKGPVGPRGGPRGPRKPRAPRPAPEAK
jgi:hypothetical protein